jgi:hypothetical protein
MCPASSVALDAALDQAAGDASDERVELAVRPRRRRPVGRLEREERRVAPGVDRLAPARRERGHRGHAVACSFVVASP